MKLFLEIGTLRKFSMTFEAGKVARTAYLDTSIFAEIGTKKSSQRKRIRELLRELSEDKVRLYTSILAVQELAVATYRAGMTAKDTYGDISRVARGLYPDERSCSDGSEAGGRTQGSGREANGQAKPEKARNRGRKT
jgi:predicted nucleic acid-binding protein